MALSRRVTGLRLDGPVRATFPVRRPVLPLDRVLVTAPARVVAVRVLDGVGIRSASDHRPLRADVALSG
jgi:endonuclease/exonuclease/phosphatase family metal-dependent hydrolase